MPQRYQFVGSALPRENLGTADLPELVDHALEHFGRKGMTNQAWATFRDAWSFDAASEEEDLSAVVEAV